jgi:hypothetical protein
MKEFTGSNLFNFCVRQLPLTVLTVFCFQHLVIFVIRKQFSFAFVMVNSEFVLLRFIGNSYFFPVNCLVSFGQSSIGLLVVVFLYQFSLGIMNISSIYVVKFFFCLSLAVLTLFILSFIAEIKNFSWLIVLF